MDLEEPHSFAPNRQLILNGGLWTRKRLLPRETFTAPADVLIS